MESLLSHCNSEDLPYFASKRESSAPKGSRLGERQMFLGTTSLTLDFNWHQRFLLRARLRVCTRFMPRISEIVGLQTILAGPSQLDFAARDKLLGMGCSLPSKSQASETNGQKGSEAHLGLADTVTCSPL